jgi:uncharacterized protein (TIGR03118 family)
MKLLKSLPFLALAVVLHPGVVLAQHYTQTNLVSNIAGRAPVTDPNLQNAWGLVHGPGTPWWISNNAGGTSTLYTGAGAIVALPTPTGGVTIPNAPSQPAPGSPTSVMFNGSATDFLLTPTVGTTPGKQAIFLWVTEDGTVQGWNPGVNLSTAIIKVDNSEKPNKEHGAVYKGATIVEVNGHKFILAANFRSGRIDVFDTTFNRVHLKEDEDDAFADDDIPDGFAPFNVQAYGPNVYVTYAKQDASKHDPVKHGEPGDGFVDVFNLHGRLISRLEHGPWFNAPWGVVLTTADFGEFSHTLLVGNFRGGTIAAFNPITGKFLGNVLNPNGSTLNIDGLWALGFGAGNINFADHTKDSVSGSGNVLFFTAGPDNEANGLFGTLTPVASELGEDDEH